MSIRSNKADRVIHMSICVARSDVVGSSGPLGGVQIVRAQGILVLVLSARASISPVPGQLSRGQLSKHPPSLAFFFTGGKFECPRTLAIVRRVEPLFAAHSLSVSQMAESWLCPDFPLSGPSPRSSGSPDCVSAPDQP